MLSRTSQCAGLQVVKSPMTAGHAQIDGRSDLGVWETSRRLATRAVESAVSLFQRSAKRLRSLASFSGLELGTEAQIEKERIRLDASLSRPPRFVESLHSVRMNLLAACNSKFQIRSIEGDQWTVMDDCDRIVCIGTKEACEDWLDYQENRASN